MSKYIHGFHVGSHADHIGNPWTSTGAALMVERPGVLVFTEIVGDGHDYSVWSDRGYTVLVRLNYSYGDGTIPTIAQYAQFAQRCAVMVANSWGVDGWVIGNEPNFRGEWPGGVPITAEDYATCFELCQDAIQVTTPDARVLVAGIAPYNADAGDWVDYLLDVVLLLAQLPGGPPRQYDGVCIHAYTHAHDPALVTSEATMDAPYQDWHYEFRTYRDFMSVIPDGVPVWITESNPGADPDNTEWQDVNNGWARAAYAEIDQWNQDHPHRQIRGLCLYRYPRIDAWWIVDRAAVEMDFAMAVEHGYEWTEEAPPMALNNGGFELPYLVVTGHDNCRVAWDWQAWAKTTQPDDVDPGEVGDCAYPEYKPITLTDDPKRVIEGEASQCWFLTSKRMNAGIMQRVAVGTGNTCLFKAQVETWCSDSDDPYTANGEMYARLIIDPAGGYDPEAPGVVRGDWHRARAQYDEIDVLAVAEANSVTVFVQFWNKWRMKHNDAYVGKAELIVTGTQPPEPPDPPDPPTPPPDGTLGDLLGNLEAALSAAMDAYVEVVDYVDANAVQQRVLLVE